MNRLRILKDTPTLYLVKSRDSAIDTSLYQALKTAGIDTLVYDDLEESLSHVFDALKNQKIRALCYPTRRERDGAVYLQYHLKTSTSPLTGRSTDTISAVTAQPLLPGLSNSLFQPHHVAFLVKSTLDMVTRHWVKTSEYQDALSANAA